jgi:hypothetical protein
MIEIIGLILFILLLYFYHINYVSKYKLNNSINTSYKDVLTPKINNTDNDFRELKKEEHNKLTKFLLKIQLFYYYNEEAYEEIVEELENFVTLYRSVCIDNSYGARFYDIMNDKKSLILNNLRSINIKLPKEYNLTDALNDLEILLDEYLDKVYYLYQNYIQKNGYTYNTKLINRKEMAYNKYSENVGSFSYY